MNVGRVFTQPGAVNLDVEFVGNNGMVLERASFSVDVKPGQTVFLSHRTYQ